MVNQIDIEDFYRLIGNLPIIDIRSEKEYQQGHIPGSINLPLFNNEERAIVGTLYKNSGRETSVLKGLELVGRKLPDFIKQLHKITDKKQILVHCWRGGMRSESMAWLFNLAGYEVQVLKGGYKAYRHFIRKEFLQKAKIIILGGLTGSGKTEILHRLGGIGEQILDLESLANHKGSVFGGYNLPDQPTNEQFENDLYGVWGNMDFSRCIWIEDESRMIGNVCIPDPLFEQMNRAPMIKIEVGKEERVKRILDEYAILEKQDLLTALKKIGEKLGGTNLKMAISALESDDFKTVVNLTLAHYDKSYTFSVNRRANPEVLAIHLEENSPEKNVDLVLEASKKIYK